MGVLFTGPLRRGGLIIYLVLISILGSSFGAKALAKQDSVVNRDDSGFPYKETYFATLTARLLKPHGIPTQIVSVPALPGRDEVAVLEGLGSLPVMSMIQPKPAPLVFLIPGHTGTAFDGMAMYLAERWFEEGYSVLVTWSPTSWRFIVGQSSTGIFGYGPADAADVYRVMIAAKERAERQLGLKATSVAATGYSLGALNAAFIKVLDQRERKLNIGGLLLLNPPLELFHAMSAFDGLLAAAVGWSRDDIDALFGYAINTLGALTSRDARDPNYYLGLDRIFPISQRQAQILIGVSSRSGLAEGIFAGQQVNDLGILKAPASRWQRNARMSEAQRYSYVTWFQRAILPFWQAQTGETSEALLAASNWQAVDSAMTSDPRVFVMHSNDDFISRPADIERLARRMGPRAIIRAHGGHCGNYWDPGFVADLRAVIRAL